MRRFLGPHLALNLLRGQAARVGLFVFCIGLGVAARVSIGAFLVSLDQALAHESRTLLAADLELSSSGPLDPARRGDFMRFLPTGTRFNSRVSLLTMASAGPPGKRRSRLIALSSTDATYPLAGALVVDGAQGPLNCAALQDGRSLFCQGALLPQLGLALGGIVRIGTRDYVVKGIIRNMPGLGASAFALGPRVLIGANQARAAGLTGVGSRLLYDLGAAIPDPGQAEALAAALRLRWGLKDDAVAREQLPPPGVLRLRTSKDAQDTLKQFFSRLSDYLGLVSLAALLLGGVGVAGLSRGFVREAAASLGVLRALGASPGFVGAVFAWQTLILGLCGGLVGSALGLAAQAALPSLLRGFMPVDLRVTLALGPPAWGLALGLLTALFFGLDPVLAGAKQSPASHLRDEDPPGRPTPLVWLWRTLGAVVFACVAAFEAKSWTRGPACFAALLLAALLVSWAGRVLLPALARLRWGRLGFTWNHAVANLGRPGLRAGASLVALGCAALLLGVLAVYQYSLLKELDPARRGGRLPDLFLLDVEKDQVTSLRAFVAERWPWVGLDMSPVVRARYLGRLGESASATDPASSTDDKNDARSMRSREQNLSWRDRLGPGEQVTQGHWMDPKGGRVEASLEDWFAERLGVHLGDVIRFDVQGVELQARVTSLRKVDWASFRPNFFILVSPWALADAPQTWLGTISGTRSADERSDMQAAIVGRFPDITLFEVAEATAKVLAVVDKMAAAVRLMAFACLGTGMVVLAGLALAQARARRGEAALLKALGASRRQLLLSSALEFGLLAALSSALGLVLSLAFGWGLLVKVLELDYHAPLGQLAWLGVLCSVTGAVVGVASTWRAYQVPVAEVLRVD